MKPAKFVAKPIPVEAIQWTGRNVPEVHAFGGDRITFMGTDGTYVIVVTPCGPSRAEEGDWIVKSTNGDLTSCAPETFAQFYDVAPAEPVHGAVKQKTNGELVLDPEAPTPEGEYLACACFDPPAQEGDAPIECGKEAVAVWDIAYMGVIIAFAQHACARHDQGIRQMAKVPPMGVRRPLKRVELAESIPDAHTGGVVLKKN